MLIIAHRGASGEYPENTLLALDQAIEQQADGIEFDVQYHNASKQLVLLHNYHVDKTTNGQGRINEFTLAELQNFDAGKGQIIPTLTQALNCISGRCVINIEVKSTTNQLTEMQAITDALVQCIGAAINDNNFTADQFVTSSFNHHLLAHIKKQQPELITAALIASCPLHYAKFTETLNVSGLNPSIETVNAQLVNDAKEKGLSIWVYTVDKKDDIALCLALGVDGIFTNYPQKSRKSLLQIINKNNHF